MYELYNGGAKPVTYEFDLTPLELIKQENFDQPIFECINPRGEIPPGRSMSVEWRFSPVEAKTYMVRNKCFCTENTYSSDVSQIEVKSCWLLAESHCIWTGS